MASKLVNSFQCCAGHPGVAGRVAGQGHSSEVVSRQGIGPNHQQTPQGTAQASQTLPNFAFDILDRATKTVMDLFLGGAVPDV